MAVLVVGGVEVVALSVASNCATPKCCAVWALSHSNGGCWW
jgi:hypothetical protein